MLAENFDDFEFWKKALETKKGVNKLADIFPFEEKYSLSVQIIRSSRAKIANIAEGFGRYTCGENLQNCVQASASLTETLNQLNDAFDGGSFDS
jgi:hypothetical protein